MRAVLLSFLLFSYSSILAQKVIRPLHQNWYFHQEGKEDRYAATVPGTVHTDLMHNKLIEDFYTGRNEHKYPWIELDNWIYETSFEVSEEDLKNEHIDLLFKGLDTYSTIELNGKIVGSTDNMFLEYRYDINQYVVKGKNELRITFESPIHRNLNESSSHSYRLPSGNETEEVQVSSYTRKAAYHFGWDFAPRAVTCGIWRPVYLELWNTIRVEDVKVTQEQLTDELAMMSISSQLRGQVSTNDSILAKCGQSSLLLEPFQGEHNIELKVEVKNPKLWFPNNYGDQIVYYDTLFIFRNNELIDSYPFSFGIRQIDLHQIEDEYGKSFFFTVNGEPIFCKGANYIPQDMFLPSVSKKQTRDLLLKVKKANMNMIRVWGGGVYESDYFYSLCDSLGIMVWQDFMFANSLYPDNPEFITSIHKEVEYNVKRLRNHPCIALWCGNNEVEVAWENWGWQNQYNIHGDDSVAIWNNYQTIFHNLIPETLRRLDRGRHYISSSPISNWGNQKGLNEGCLHYWGVWHGKQPLESYKENDGRFVSEYGFPSYPTDRLLENYIDFNDTIAARKELESRMKSYIGIQGIEKEIDKYFSPASGNIDLIEKSLAVQAYGIRLATQSHRLSAPKTMGSLIWQLNDCWPGPSWSLIDYSGREKPAYYEAMIQFSPVMVAAETNNDTLTLTAVSDLPKTRELEIELYFVNQAGERYYEQRKKFQLKALKPLVIFTIPLSELKTKLQQTADYLQYFVRDVETQEIIYGDSYFFLPPKDRTTPIMKIE